MPEHAGRRSSRPGQNGGPLDTDDDGIPDLEDACPLVKGPRTGDSRTNGCPALVDHPPPPGDRDHDGVPDVEDACPDVPGRRHPDPNRNGCPDVLIGTTEVTVFHKILFKTNSAEILPESNPILDKVADALNAHPDLVLIEVAGHADERGSEQLKSRADAGSRRLGPEPPRRARAREDCTRTDGAPLGCEEATKHGVSPAPVP